MEKYGRALQAIDGNIIWCIRFACWINKAIDTHIHTLTQKSNNYCFLTTTIVTGMRLKIALYVRVHCLSCGIVHNT